MDALRFTDYWRKTMWPENERIVVVPHKGDLEAKQSQWDSEKTVLTQKVSTLEADVTRLTPPPAEPLKPAPPLTALDAESELKKVYQELDALQNQEKATELFAKYDPKFVVETDQFTNDLKEFKISLVRGIFQPSVHHLQTTDVEEPPQPGGSRVDRIEGIPSEATGEQKRTLVELVDNETVNVPVTRRIQKWLKARTVPSDSIEEEFTTINDSTEQVYRQKDTWKKRDDDWILVKSAVLSVAEYKSEAPLPPLKCRNVTCGNLYLNGIEAPFLDTGKAVKHCPVCHNRLYFVVERRRSLAGRGRR